MLPSIVLRSAFDDLTVRVVRIEAVVDQMKFDIEHVVVEAGDGVEIVSVRICRDQGVDDRAGGGHRPNGAVDAASAGRPHRADAGAQPAGLAHAPGDTASLEA